MGMLEKPKKPVNKGIGFSNKGSMPTYPYQVVDRINSAILCTFLLHFTAGAKKGKKNGFEAVFLLS